MCLVVVVFPRFFILMKKRGNIQHRCSVIVCRHRTIFRFIKHACKIKTQEVTEPGSLAPEDGLAFSAGSPSPPPIQSQPPKSDALDGEQEFSSILYAYATLF